MTGGELSTHATVTAASAAAAGVRTAALSLHPGAFAEATVADALNGGPVQAGDAGVVYLRGLLRWPGSWRLARVWAGRWRGLRALMAQSGPVVLVCDPIRARRAGALLQRLAALLLTAGAPGRARWQCTAAPPPALLHSLGIEAPVLAPKAAERAVFERIAAADAGELRLTDQHVARALAGPAGQALPEPVQRDILSLARLARAVSARQVDAAARFGRLRPDGAMPLALQIALGPHPDRPGRPWIAEHLRSLGKRRRHWRRHVPAAGAIPRKANGPFAAVLRQLARQPRPGDDAILADLERPIAGPGTISRRDWIALLALRTPVERYDSLSAPWACPHLARSVAAALGEPAPAGPAAPPRLCLVGIEGNATGIAQNLAMSREALALAGIPAAVERGPATPGAALGIAQDTTLYHLNADRIPTEMMARGARGLSIGFLLWELDRVPPAHALGLAMLDEVWVPSVFLKRVYQRAARGPVQVMRKGIRLPAPQPWPKPAGGVRRFVVAFDQRSSVARKNPAAAVRAFQTAFGRRADVELIAKTTPAPPGHWGDPERQMAWIRAAAAADPRIRLVEALVPFPRLLGLIQGATALISPHRAEGFGYLPAYALALGTPVVVTDHSGTRDFCTPETADPVPAQLVPVPRGHAIWRTPGARWAEVDVDAMAAALRAIADDPAAARARAARGQAVIETDYSMAAQAARYRDRLAALGVLAPEEPAARAAGA